MRSFKEFLLVEGGNVKVGGVGASSIELTDKTRGKFQNDVSGALKHLHNSFHKAHGEHLFGPKASALSSGEAYSGSTRALMDRGIDHAEFTKHKPSVGDIDVKIPAEHGDKLVSHLTPGRKFGKFTVIGHKKAGVEIHALLQHENGNVHQFDFEKTHYENGRPNAFSTFGHSAHWDDIKSGIKGVHHKVLLNAIGLDHHKFGNSKGLMSRTDEKAPPITDTHQMASTLFGAGANEKHMHSFKGLVNLIHKHIPAHQHQAIVDKFASSLKAIKADHGPALNHISKKLGVKPTVTESATGDSHVSVVPLTGFSPISHMGHAADLGSKLSTLPGKKHIGVSAKADLFSPKERSSILKKQWGQKDAKVHFSGSAGDVVARAYHSMPEGRRHLHLLVGHDRLDFAHRLKSSLEAGKVKEMNGGRFDSITVHTPDDTDRSHGMSGTKMRMAAHQGDIGTFHQHLGPMFTREQAQKVMGRVKKGLDSGQIKLKR